MKDQADASAASSSEFLGRRFEKIFSLEQDFAILDFTVVRQKLQKGSCKRALAGTRFSKYA